MGEDRTVHPWAAPAQRGTQGGACARLAGQTFALLVFRVLLLLAEAELLGEGLQRVPPRHVCTDMVKLGTTNWPDRRNKVT